jgi:hypothetical protein
LKRRKDWIKEQRHVAEENYDKLWAPLCDEEGGFYGNTSQQQFMQKFLRPLLQPTTILDAACGTGRYISMLLEKGHTVRQPISFLLKEMLFI